MNLRLIRFLRWGPLGASFLTLLAHQADGDQARKLTEALKEGKAAVNLRKTAASLRAGRRAYDGAPPVIPHENFAIACTSCHNLLGMEVAQVGFAPPSPHEHTMGMSAVSRCNQCHVAVATLATFHRAERRGTG